MDPAQAQELLNRLTPVFRRVLRTPDLQLTPQLAAADVAGWDSLAHAELIAAVEKEFQVKFKLKEMIRWRNVGDMLTSLSQQ